MDAMVTYISAIASTSGSHAVSGASYGALPNASLQEKLSNLFDSIDKSRSGIITKSQFNQAFQTKNPPASFQRQGADATFAALDPTNSGSVSKKDFVSGLSQLSVNLRAGSPAPSIPQPAETLAASLKLLERIDIKV